MNDLINSNKTLYFLVLCLSTLLLLFAKKAFIEYETAAFLVLEQKGELGVFKFITSLQYLSIPIIYASKFVIITFLLWIGSFLFGYRLTFTDLFGLVIIGETIFLLPELLKILWFMVGDSDPNYYDIRAFYPFSLMHFFDYTEVGARYHYPLKALNVFEVGYWFFLVYLIHYKAKKKISITYGIVFLSYVLFFLIWLWFYATVYK